MKLFKISLIIFCMYINLSLAKETTKNIQVSATVVYNCQVIDIKATKYCNNVELKQENNVITIKY